MWDTAGQERFRTMTRSYYRGSRGLMLVFDLTCRSSFDNLTRWIEQLRNNILDAFPPILLGTPPKLSAAYLGMKLGLINTM